MQEVVLAIALTVNWGGVTADEPFPVTGGIPFARGQLKSTDAVELLRNDEPVPVQTEVLATWPDGSVKWLLLDFQATPGQKDFQLVYGRGAKRKAHTHAIWARRQDGVVEVKTGAVEFSVRSDGTGFIDELTWAGNTVSDSKGRRLNFLDFLHTKSPADYHPMNRTIPAAEEDPSKVVVTDVTLEKTGPLHAVVRIDGKYTYKKVGSTIEGTDVKGDCPFRIRIHAYLNQRLLKVEHFFYYEGDGDHDFGKSLGLKLGLPAGAGTIRFIGEETVPADGPIAGVYQQSADAFEVWNSEGSHAHVVHTGGRFEGVLDVVRGPVGVAVGVKDAWRNYPKSLHADLNANEVAINLYPPEAPPLDFRRHAREWSVGETGTHDGPDKTKPSPFTAKNHPNYRLASKGVGKTHTAMIYLHPINESPERIRNVYRLFNHRPLLFAEPKHYARTLALGRYRERVKGEHDDVEEALDRPVKFWKFSQDHFRWYGFWIYGNVCQDYGHYFQNGRWCREFGRWGWANGDSVGRLAYALMLQAVRKCERDDFEFAEAYLHNVHDVCSTHTPAYPHHYRNGFNYVKGAAHRHGAWPWACPYVGARGAHPVGAKIYYYLTGEGHAKDILEEITELALKNPNGGEGDGPLGPNAQIYLYKWETTGKDEWRDRLKKEIDDSKGLKEADSGWLCMMNAAFGILNALEEYQELSGDTSRNALLTDYADRSSPEKYKRHWTWGGYYRVYSGAYNVSRDPKYRGYIEEMLEVLVGKAGASVAFKIPEGEWPGPPGGPGTFVDGNIVRDVPFALYSLHLEEASQKATTGKPFDRLKAPSNVEGEGE